MGTAEPNEAVNVRKTTRVERTSGTELVVRRTFDAPAKYVFDAWTKPELMQRWWMPKSVGITSFICEMDARTGGSYRFEFEHPDFEEPMVFFGRYLEVTPHTTIMWTNEESGVNGAITTVTLEERDGKTYLTMYDRYPTEQALSDTIDSGATSGFDESFSQLDDLLYAIGRA